jgi:hypothetical protein
MSAASGWARVAGASGMAIGDYNALKEMDITNSKAVVVLSDLKSLEKALNELGPEAFKKFKKDARQLGHPARDALRSVFRSVGIHGPLGAPRRPPITAEGICPTLVALPWELLLAVLTSTTKIELRARRCAIWPERRMGLSQSLGF